MKPLVFWLAAAIWSPAVLAATFSVTRSDDPTPDGCLVNDCSLREAVIAADDTAEMDTVLVPPGLYPIVLNGADFSAETGDLDITTDMEIIGQDAVIDGQSQGRIMDISGGASVLLEGLRFANGNTSIATNGTLNAGALQITGASVTVRDAVFENNAAQTLGGAIYLANDAQLLVEDSAFVANSARTGGAIHAISGLTLRNVLLEGNDAEQNGGALYLAGTESDSRLEQVTFSANTGNDGCGILFLGRTLDVDAMVASSNTCSGGGGGALNVLGTAHVKTLTLANVVFVSNSSGSGGAVAFRDADDTMRISHASFVNNQATGQGGALFHNTGTIELENATFSGNQSNLEGGAVRSIFGGDVTLRHVTITGGSASEGSAISVLNSPTLNVTLSNTLIDGTCDLSSAGSITSSGGNLEGPGDSCELVAATDLVMRNVAQLGIGPLRSALDVTPHHPLTAASEARGQGDAGVCDAVAVDQLFNPRDTVCASGAVESEELFADSFEVRRTLGSSVVVAL